MDIFIIYPLMNTILCMEFNSKKLPVTQLPTLICLKSKFAKVQHHLRLFQAPFLSPAPGWYIVSGLNSRFVINNIRVS